ncbi:MAG TPA: flagellar biosynthetic protein FliR [Geminicoccaceae bacterium]|nr:flagellar biosynthetic protein FliR [Geminicoccaceae bacterium]
MTGAPLPELVADEVFRVLLVFCRVGAALMLLPGFGEPYVPPRLRLLLALGLSLLLAAALGPGGLLPAAPASPAALALLVGHEVLVGLFLGTAARTLLGALHVAGTAIAYQSSLAGASVFDPGAATQGTLPGNLLTTTALVLLFVTDGHHVLLQALAASYAVGGGLEPGAGPPLGDMAELFGRLVADAFALGLRIAAPVVLVSLLLYLGLGVLNRLMPALQVFFIALPLQILLAFATLMLSLAGGLLAFFAFFGDGVARLVPGV